MTASQYPPSPATPTTVVGVPPTDTAPTGNGEFLPFAATALLVLAVIGVAIRTFNRKEND